MSNELGQILDKLLQYLPKDRYQDADEVLQDLNALVIGHRSSVIGNSPPLPRTDFTSSSGSPRSVSPPLRGGWGGSSASGGGGGIERERTPSPQSPPQRDFEFDVATVSGGQISNRQRSKAQYFAEDLGNGITLDMVSIPGGTFLMGSPDSELERDNDESPQHKITLAPFFMGKTPVTQAQWQIVAELPQIKQSLNRDPSKFKGANLPVECVSWYDAVEFCARLSAKTGRNYYLPSEAQWEYACRAGTTTPFHFGETITPELANYNGHYIYGSGCFGEYRQQTTVVGSFQVANAFGLYDMHGNVWEWCADVWHENYQGATSDGSVWAVGGDDTLRLLRGGSWRNLPKSCRSANRSRYAPALKYDSCGFRVAVGAG